MENDTALPVETKRTSNKGTPDFCLVCVYVFVCGGLKEEVQKFT